MPFLLILLTLAATSDAAPPTQADVFKSIQNSMGGNGGGPASSGGEIDFKKLLPYLLAAGGLVIVAILYGQRQERPAVAKSLNHHGKLLKEIGKSMQLRPAEMRQLKQLADELPGNDDALSPLTMLLCPSVMAKSINARKGRGGRVTTDRKLLSQLARKAGVTNEMLARES